MTAMSILTLALQAESGDSEAVAATASEGAEEDKKKSAHVQRKLAKRQQGHKLDNHLETQFESGRLFACISSRPGQCGRCDGYALGPCPGHATHVCWCLSS